MVQKYGIFFLIILKTLEHFENSQRKLSHGFLETVPVESVKITYIEQLLQMFKTAEKKNVGFSIHKLSKC